MPRVLPYAGSNFYHPHYSSDDGCSPKRLMARQMMLTHPTAIRVMIAMVHLASSSASSRFHLTAQQPERTFIRRMIISA